MNQEQTALKTAKSVVLFAVIFLFPIFFLPLTQEYFSTNKVYLLAAAALGLLGISLAEMIMSKKLVWEKRHFDTNLLLFIAAIVLSVLITAPNKIMTLFNFNYGVVPTVSMTVIAFYLARNSTLLSKKQGLFEGINQLTVLTISTVLLAVISIVMFFQPFRSISLPPSLQFLSTPSFTPLGSQIDLAILFGFVALALSAAILTGSTHGDESTQKDGLNTPMIASVASVSVILIGLIFTMFQILKPNASGTPSSAILLPPYRLSWYAAVETLKNPLTAIFGIGMNNFSSIFTAIKDPAYNQSSLWQVQSFNVARSTLLHVLATTGVFGLVAFFLLIMNAIRSMIQHKVSKTIMTLFAFVAAIIIFMPPSLTIFFLLFLLLGTISHQIKPAVHGEHHSSVELNLAKITPLYAGLILISILLIAGSAYIVGRSYMSEYYFKQSLNGLISNSAQDLYENQRQAIVLNPYNDKFRISFSQTNLLIANNLAAQANQRQLNDTERQTIIQTIQAAIQEAKAAVILNPASAGNWENLAIVYRNILNIAQGADGWTVASYQRAIALDPQNPNLWLNLGGVFYSLGNYEQATRMFEQAVTLKPDWPNALYNLAWSAEQRGDHVSAAILMQRVTTLMDPVKDEADYKKAQADFESFRAKIPAQPQQPAQTQEQPQQLSLPTPPAATLEPKLKLPTEPESPEPPIIPREESNNETDGATVTPTQVLSPTQAATPSGN